jgi:hypothetical protein
MLTQTAKFFAGALLALACVIAGPSAVRADLAAVGPINLQNGFPLWWQDQNGTQIEICLVANCPPGAPVVTGNPFSQQIGFGAEAFWWAAGADLANPAGLGLFELAMEAAFLTEDPAPGDQQPFVRLRTRLDTALPGTYTITYPFGTLTVDVAAVGAGPEINETIDIAGSLTDLPPFSAALATGVPPVVAGGAANGVSVFFSALNPAPPAGFMGVPGAASTIDVTGLVNGATVTVTGPANGFAPGVDTLTNNDLWDVAGKLFIPGINLAPLAIPDMAGTSIATPVTFNVAGNDKDLVVPGVNDHGINPLAVALGNDSIDLINNAIGAGSTVPTPQGGSATINANGSITYSPAPTFTGQDIVTYLVQDTGGLVDVGQAIVTVEQLAASRATLRQKILKWDIGGDSTVVNLSTSDELGNTVYFTPLSGAINTPPKPDSSGSGSAVVTVLTNGGGTVIGLDISLEINGLTGITAAHIHAGPDGGFLGDIRPIAVTLFDADGTPGVGGPTAVDSPLVVGPLTRFPDGDPRNTETVEDVDDPVGGPLPDLQAVVDAIVAGRAYVQVHTLANLPGEIRGQLGHNTVALRVGNASGPVIGAAAVEGAGVSGSWRFSGKSPVNPGSVGVPVHATFASGNVITIPLERR